MSGILPTVYWPISCFDKRRANPLPVYNRQFILDWNALDASQVSQILHILNLNDDRSVIPSNLDSAVVSIRRSPTRADERMLAFRKYFIELDEAELERRSTFSTSFHCVNLNRQYFEDENGNEISEYAMIQHVSGQDEPIIVGDAGSILRLALSDPRPDSNWTVDAANTIGQFLDVVRRIAASDWYRHPQTMTFELKTGGDPEKFPDAKDTRLLEAVFPNDAETVAVLAYFRQLHAGDRLFLRACDVFVNTCQDERKNWWIAERQATFANMIDSPPTPYAATESRREIIRMFMYGAGLLHASSSHGDDKKLAGFIQTHGKHRAVAIFNGCLWDVLRIAIPVYHVIFREFSHWTNVCKLTPPSRLDIPTLFDKFGTQEPELK